jgi:hypothetical protein
MPPTVIGYVNPAPCCPPPVFELFQGDAVQMNLQVIQGTLPYDLTSATDINVQLPLTAGGVTSLKLSASPPEVVIQSPTNWGLFNVPAAAIGAISSGLMVGELQDFAVTFTFASGPVTVLYRAGLTVNQVN